MISVIKKENSTCYLLVGSVINVDILDIKVENDFSTTQGLYMQRAKNKVHMHVNDISNWET